MSSRNERDLNKRIIQFVNTWDEVIDLKLEEYNSKEKKKSRLRENNKKRAEEDPTSPFAFIYTWLNVNSDGEIAPHESRPKDQNKKKHLRNKTYPIAADISDYFCQYMPGNYTDDDSVIRSVNRALPKLADDGFLRLAPDHTYRPQTIEYYRKMVFSNFVSYSNIGEKQFFSVSKSTYIIYFQANKLDNEIQFLKKYVGEKNLFDIVAVDTKLIILLKGKADEAEKTGIALRKLVENAYEEQERMRNKSHEILNNEPIVKMRLVNKEKN